MARYDSRTDDGKCIFCEIASGRINPLGNGLFWNTKDYMAWLSPFPNTEGSTVLIPKQHYSSDVLSMPDEKLSELVLEAKKVSKLLIDFFDDVGRIGLMIEGMGVDHAHIKLFPMHATANLKKGEWKQRMSSEERYFETYPGYIISNDGPKANFSKLKELAKKLESHITV
jgi:histidine triad (HIT) family protein